MRYDDYDAEAQRFEFFPTSELFPRAADVFRHLGTINRPVLFRRSFENCQVFEFSHVIILVKLMKWKRAWQSFKPPRSFFSL
jgi:hypothetical protein